MPLTASDVAHLADLARIEMTEEELIRLSGQLDVILDAVASVSAAASDDVAPTSHALAFTNVFRDDVVAPSLPPEAVLAAAPAVEDGRFRIPRILESHVGNDLQFGSPDGHLAALSSVDGHPARRPPPPYQGLHQKPQPSKNIPHTTPEETA